MSRVAVAPLAVLAVAGCTLGPDYRQPVVPAPEGWRTPAGGEGSLADLRWWQLFQDPALQGLVAAALDANTDLRLAAARVLGARAQLGLTRSGQFPQVDANGRVAPSGSRRSAPSRFLRGAGCAGPPRRPGRSCWRPRTPPRTVVLTLVSDVAPARGSGALRPPRVSSPRLGWSSPQPFTSSATCSDRP